MPIRVTLTGGEVLEAEGDEDTQRVIEFVARLSGRFGARASDTADPAEAREARLIRLEADLSADLRARIDQANPATDQELAVVLAEAAIAYGWGGLDRRDVERLATLASEEQPTSWRATFANARNAGLLENRDGAWVPTQEGLRRINSKSPRRNGRRSRSPD